MTDTTLRLAKLVADTFSCSRREAENYVAGGWVTVDGEVVEEAGARVRPTQAVALRPGARPEEVEPVTLLLHKPVGYGASDQDESAGALLTRAHQMAEDRSGTRVLNRHFDDLILATPLAFEASGLVVLTQERSVARKLLEEAGKVEQEFVVEVAGALSEAGLKQLNHGLSFDGKPLPPMKVSWQSERRLRFAMKTAPLGVIDDMCRQVGLNVVNMKRIRIGRLSMAGLPSGQWRYLLGYERF